jgi:hypothetical protein
MYKELCRQNSPKEALFLNELLLGQIDITGTDSTTISKNSNKEVKIVGKEIFRAFAEWCRDNKFNQQFEPNIKQFYTQIQNRYITRVKHNGYEHLKFIPSELHKYIIQMKWIDDDEASLFIDEKDTKEDDNVLDKEFENYF